MGTKSQLGTEAEKKLAAHIRKLQAIGYVLSEHAASRLR